MPKARRNCFVWLETVSRKIRKDVSDKRTGASDRKPPFALEAVECFGNLARWIFDFMCLVHKNDGDSKRFETVNLIPSKLMRRQDFSKQRTSASSR